MKFRCERDVIVEALGIAGRAVSGRGGMPGLSGVRAELVGDTLTLTGSDLDLTISISLTVSGESDGVAVIPARLATDIVKALKPGAVSFAAADESLSIASDRSEFSIRLIAGDEFPKTAEPGADSVSLSSAQLAEALKQVVLAASTDDSRPILTGVLLAAEADGLRLVATDSFRLAMRDVPGVDREVLRTEALGQARSVVSRAIDVCVWRIRSKIEADPASPVHLVTVYGQGYRLCPRHRSGAHADEPARGPGRDGGGGRRWWRW